MRQGLLKTDCLRLCGFRGMCKASDGLKKMTLGNGYLGSRIDEERSEIRYLV